MPSISGPSMTDSGTTASIEGVWGSSANDVWAVGDHVVSHFGFDLGDASQVKVGVLAQRPRGVGRNFADLGQRLGRRQLDFEPLAVLVFVGPDATHLGPRVSGDQKEKTSLGLSWSATSSRVSAAPISSSARPTSSCAVAG